MRQIRASRQEPKRDYAPSKWRYRMQRWMLTPAFMRTLKIGMPILVIGGAFGLYFSNPDNRAMVSAQITDAQDAFQQRPEFMVKQLTVTGANDEIATQVERVVQVDFPISSFDLDLERVKNSVSSLNRVKTATVKIGDGGALVIEVTPRQPVAIWRDGGVLNLMDADGIFSGALANRGDRPDLPLIAGEGAFAEIDEALGLFARAKPLGDRVRGLVRIGERRWDLVLDRDQSIQLPAENPGPALDRIIVLDQANDLLNRDVALVDMRNGTRPTVRLTSEAANALRRISERRVSDE